MNKVKTLRWFVVLLVLLNLSTIISIVYHKYQETGDNDVIVFDASSESRLNGRYFRQTLGFNNNQMEAFRQANRTFQPKANAIIFRIDSMKNDVFTELKNDNSDTVKLGHLSENIGIQHSALKKAINQFYLEIKDVCTTEQKEQLNEVFSPLFKNQYPVNQGIHRNRQNNLPKK